MEETELFRNIEALLFVSGEPVLIDDLKRALFLTDLEMQAFMERMKERYEKEDRGIRLFITDKSLQLVTNPECASFIERFYHPPKEKTLSQSLMETMALIAYKQPITRAEIEAIRGVRSEYAVSTLLKQGFIRELGRRNAAGHPVELGTTDAFLRLFGLRSLNDLPSESE